MMRKFILTSLALTGAFVVSAQGLFFQYDGETLTNGAVIEYSDYDVYPTGSQYEVAIEPAIFIISETANPINIKATSNYPIQLCIGGQCESAESVLKEDLTLNAGIPENLLLDCVFTTDNAESPELPAIEVKLEAWYVLDPDNVVTMTLKMGDTGAVSSVFSDATQIRYANRTLSYDLTGPSHISVYSLSGKTLMDKNVSGSGTLCLSDLSTGIYLYRVTDKKGNTVKASKIIIK